MQVMLLDANPELQNRLQRIIDAGGDAPIELLRLANDQAVVQGLQRRRADTVVINAVGWHSTCDRLIKRLLELQADLHVIVYTDREDRDSISATLRAGAVGYIFKNASLEELLDGLHIVAGGGAAICPTISRLVLQEIQKNSLANSLPFLTKREKQVFQCIEDSLSYKGISSKLNISRNTVHTHVKSIYSKLHAVDKHDALNKARQFAVAC